MQTKIATTLLGTTVENNTVTASDQSKVNQIQNLNTQVKAAKPKIFRRKFSTADKLKILEAFDSCENLLDRNALLRKNGLYSGSITKWRRQLSEKDSNHANSKAYKLILAHNQIMRENVALKKKLAQAEAIIDLQKKVSELLSTHVLAPKTSEE
jgi:transposase